MAKISLPQQEDRSTREGELKAQGAPYAYNYDMGVPLIEKEQKEDKSRADQQVKALTLLMKLRINQQAIYDKSGFKFMRPKPARDIPQFLEVIKGTLRPEDYFVRDPGFLTVDEHQTRATSIDDYIDKVFLSSGALNLGPASVPEVAKKSGERRAGDGISQIKFDDDRSFAYSFVGGPNANQLQRWTEQSKPVNFDISKINLGSLPGFNGDRIESAIASGRVYFVDRSDMNELFSSAPDAPAPNAASRVLDKVQSKYWKYQYAPLVALAVPPNGKNLLPIGIQCGPSSDGHQIYTPVDGYSWKMAKVCMLAAHNNHHEVISHLGLTHLYVDPIVMATRIRLHKNHPVYALLHPHFEGTASINYGARTSLTIPGKSVDRLVGTDIYKNYPYIAKHRLAHSFRDNFPKVRQARLGVADAKLLPNYPYREDSILIWDAIHDWVSSYISIWYTSEEAIRSDYELQSWAAEVNDIGRVKDFSLTGGGIQSRDDLIDVLTMTIFTAGPQHAAVNFPQGTDMAFVPANPLAGYAQAPKGLGHTERDFLDILPPLDVAIHTLAILRTLAGIYFTQLGDYRGAFLNNPIAETQRLKFVANLALIEAKIKVANVTRKQVYGYEYDHLRPSFIPASTNI